MTNMELGEEQCVDQILTDIFEDQQEHYAEKRKDHRELLFMPVKVSQTEFEFTVRGFTRDISTHGVCLIMPQPFREGVEAQIDLVGQTAEIASFATCCWSSKFGDAYWVSGWRLKEEIAVGRLIKEDRSVELEQRTGDRLHAAVPVSIYLRGNPYRIPSFTRNLSRSGLCLVSKVETQPDQIADLEIMRTNGESGRIESHCMWAKQYGEDHWVSGWRFG